MNAVRLSDYLEISTSPSSDLASSQIQVDGHWVRLKEMVEKWPSALRSQWHQELFFLFPAGGRIGRLDPKDRVTLCHEVHNCQRKGGESEHRGCPYFNQGICVQATSSSNGLRPLSFGTIGAFNGISKQRVQQIYSVAQKKVIRAAARDPVLREFYTNLGLRPENLPDPRKLAGQLESCLQTS